MIEQIEQGCKLNATTIQILDNNPAQIIIMVAPAATEDIELQKLDCIGRNEEVAITAFSTDGSINDGTVVKNNEKRRHDGTNNNNNADSVNKILEEERIVRKEEEDDGDQQQKMSVEEHIVRNKAKKEDDDEEQQLKLSTEEHIAHKEEAEKEDDGEQQLQFSAEERLLRKKEARNEDDVDEQQLQVSAEEHITRKEELDKEDDGDKQLQVSAEERILRKEEAEKEDDDDKEQLEVSAEEHIVRMGDDEKQLKVSTNTALRDEEPDSDEIEGSIDFEQEDSKTDLYISCHNVDIHKRSFQRLLSPTSYLDDSLILLRIKTYFVEHPRSITQRIHVFDPLFYSSYLNSKHRPYEYAEVQHQTKNIELFSLDFILIPIVYNSHWSLCVVVRPIEWMLHLYLSDVAHDDNNTQAQEHNNMACLLFVDSLLGEHTFSTDIQKHVRQFDIQKRVKQFLSDEWKHKLIAAFSGSSIVQPSSATSSHTTYTETELFSFKQQILSCDQYSMDCRDGKCLFSDLPAIVCNQAPQQQNGYDCGIFCYKFAEVILNFSPTSLQSDLNNGFSDFFNAKTFSQADVTAERKFYRIFLELMRESHIARISRKSPPSSPTSAKDDCSPSVVYVQTSTKQQRLDAADKTFNDADLMPPPQRRDKAILLHRNTIEVTSTNHCFVYFEMQYHHYTTGNNIASEQSFQSGYISPFNAHLHIGVVLQNDTKTSNTFVDARYDLQVISLHVDTYRMELEHLFQYENNTPRLYEELSKLQQSAPFRFHIISIESFANEYSNSNNSEISHWWSNHLETFQIITMVLYAIYFNDPVWYTTSMNNETVVRLSTLTSAFCPQYRFFSSEEDQLDSNLEVIFYRQGDVLSDVAKKGISTNCDQKSYSIFKDLKSSKIKPAAASIEDKIPVVVTPSAKDSYFQPKLTPVSSDSEFQNPPQNRSSQRQKKRTIFLAEEQRKMLKEKKEETNPIKTKATKLVVEGTTSASTSACLPKRKTNSKVQKRKYDHHHSNDYELSYDDNENAGNDYDHQDFGINSSTSSTAPLLAESGGNQKHPTKRQTRQQKSAVKPYLELGDAKNRSLEEIDNMIAAAVKATSLEAKKEIMLSKTSELELTVEKLKAVTERLQLEKLVAEKDKKVAEERKLEAEKQRVEAEKQRVVAELEAKKLKVESIRIMAQVEQHRKDAEAQKEEALLQLQLRKTAEQDAKFKALIATKDMEYKVLKTKFDCNIENSISKRDIKKAELKGVEFFQKGLEYRSESLKESSSLVQSVLCHSSSFATKNNNLQQETPLMVQYDPAAEDRKKREWRREYEKQKLQKQIEKAEKQAAEMAESVKQLAEQKAALDRKVKALSKEIVDFDSDEN